MIEGWFEKDHDDWNALTNYALDRSNYHVYIQDRIRQHRKRKREERENDASNGAEDSSNGREDKRARWEVTLEVPASDEEEAAEELAPPTPSPPPRPVTPPPKPRRYVEHVVEPLPPKTERNPFPKKAERWVLLDDDSCSTTSPTSLHKFIDAPPGTAFPTKRLNTRLF